MARPKQDGLLYFSFDTDFFFADKRIKRLHSKFNNDGLILYIYLLTEAYRNKGYYISWDEEMVEDIAADLHLKEGFIEQVLSFLHTRSLLTVSTLAMGDTVITSPGIQKRYQEAKKGSKRQIEVDAEIWLLNEEETASCIKVTHNGSNSEKNPSNSEKNLSNSEKNDIKESKGNKSKVKESKNTRACVTKFNEFFSAYPKKVNMQAAEKEYMLVLYNNQTLTEEELIASARNYAEDVSILKTEEKFVKNPDRFLRDGRYFDYLDMNYKRPIKESKYGRELEEWMNE